MKNLQNKNLKLKSTYNIYLLPYKNPAVLWLIYALFYFILK